jgi:hypothetical protein
MGLCPHLDQRGGFIHNVIGRERSAPATGGHQAKGFDGSFVVVVSLVLNRREHAGIDEDAHSPSAPP